MLEQVDIKKPCFQPPGWIIGPVWTILYIMIGVSACLIWNLDDQFSSKHYTAWAVFFFQMILNYAWPLLFFHYALLFVSLIDIIIMAFSIYLNIFLFYQILSMAGLLLIPYAIWVSFASIINFEIWRLNRHSRIKEKTKLIE